MKKILLALCALMVFTSYSFAEEATYSFNGIVVNSGYDRKVSLSAAYRGEFWIKFKDLRNTLNLNLNINIHKYVSIMPFGLNMDFNKSFDNLTGGDGYLYKKINWQPGVYFHVPVKTFLIGGGVYVKSEFNLKTKTDNGDKIDSGQFYRPYFGVMLLGMADLGTVQPFIGYNLDAHVNFKGYRPGVYLKHYVMAGLNIKLVNNLIILSPDFKLRVYPDALYHKAEAIAGWTVAVNIK